MEQPETEKDGGRRRRGRSPAYYVQVLRDADAVSDWVTVDVTDDRREAARIAAAAARDTHEGSGEPAHVRVIGSAELLRRGGQDAINRAARDLWAGADRQDER
jgi:hypothetical protein